MPTRNAGLVTIGTGRDGTLAPQWATAPRASSNEGAAMHNGRRCRREPRYRAFQRSMVDARSGEVVFVSHCLLNQNTRYLGGAALPGVVAAAIAPYLQDGTGIVQMPCPEQRV